MGAVTAPSARRRTAVDLRFHSTPLSGSVPKVEEKPHIALVVTAEVENFAPVHGGIEDPWQYPVVFEEVIGVGGSMGL